MSRCGAHPSGRRAMIRPGCRRMSRPACTQATPPPSQTHTHTRVAPPLPAGPGSRLQQICEWLGGEDYLVVLDEAHRRVTARSDRPLGAARRPPGRGTLPPPRPAPAVQTTADAVRGSLSRCLPERHRCCARTPAAVPCTAILTDPPPTQPTRPARCAASSLPGPRTASPRSLSPTATPAARASSSPRRRCRPARASPASATPRSRTTGSRRARPRGWAGSCSAAAGPAGARPCGRGAPRLRCWAASPRRSWELRLAVRRSCPVMHLPHAAPLTSAPPRRAPGRVRAAAPPAQRALHVRVGHRRDRGREPLLHGAPRWVAGQGRSGVRGWGGGRE